MVGNPGNVEAVGRIRANKSKSCRASKATEAGVSFTKNTDYRRLFKSLAMSELVELTDGTTIAEGLLYRALHSKFCQKQVKTIAHTYTFHHC